MELFHDNFLDTSFKNKNFLTKFKTLVVRKSRTDPWYHHLVEVKEKELNKVILKVQKNLKPKGYYTHLYNRDGSYIVVIFPKLNKR